MSEPIAYRDACGPRALAAITGLDMHDVAGQLSQLARTREGSIAPATYDDTLEWWLVRRGFDVEPWVVHEDRPLRPAAEHAIALRTVRHIEDDRALVVSRIAAEHNVPVAELEAQVTACKRKRPRLIEWAASHPEGTWLVFVDEHVLAFEDGHVLAGDFADLRQYAMHTVVDASRISRPDGRQAT